jgi:hypothetical protein
LSELAQVPATPALLLRELELIPLCCSWEDAQTQAEQDFISMQLELKKAKGFAVPSWSIPRAIWQMICMSKCPFVELLMLFMTILRHDGEVLMK